MPFQWGLSDIVVNDEDRDSVLPAASAYILIPCLSSFSAFEAGVDVGIGVGAPHVTTQCPLFQGLGFAGLTGTVNDPSIGGCVSQESIQAQFLLAPTPVVILVLVQVLVEMLAYLMLAFQAYVTLGIMVSSLAVYTVQSLMYLLLFIIPKVPWRDLLH